MQYCKLTTVLAFALYLYYLTYVDGIIIENHRSTAWPPGRHDWQFTGPEAGCRKSLRGIHNLRRRQRHSFRKQAEPQPGLPAQQPYRSAQRSCSSRGSLPHKVGQPLGLPALPTWRTCHPQRSTKCTRHPPIQSHRRRQTRTRTKPAGNCPRSTTWLPRPRLGQC